MCQRGCRPRTARPAHAASFKYPGFCAMLDNIAPGLGTERGGDVQHSCAPGVMDADVPLCAPRALRGRHPQNPFADGLIPIPCDSTSWAAGGTEPIGLLVDAWVSPCGQPLLWAVSARNVLELNINDCVLYGLGAQGQGGREQGRCSQGTRTRKEGTDTGQGPASRWGRDGGCGQGASKPPRAERTKTRLSPGGTVKVKGVVLILMIACAWGVSLSPLETLS